MDRSRGKITFHLPEKIIFEWTVLKKIARSPLGRMVFLVPFLPFAIDFLEQVVEAIEFTERAVNTKVLSKWVENNRHTLTTMYLGLSIFLVSRILFEITCPKNVKNYDDSDHCIVSTLSKMKISKEAHSEEAHRFFEHRLENLMEIKAEDTRDSEPLRCLLSIGFIVSTSLLVLPPLGKFIRIFLDYLWPF